jgi:folate-dependent phosphoribosylglycinamide formyltransferase PurN
VALLAADSASTRAVYHALAGICPVELVVLEGRPSRRVFLRNRVRRLGATEVAGQLAFQAGIVPVLRALSRQRSRDIARQFGISSEPIPAHLVERVPSANDDATIALLQRYEPRVVVVNGTRILSKRLLNAVGAAGATFINMHAGITPLFRGVHGGYWALATGQPENCGVTVHVVDAGVDTGSVLGQARIEPTAADNFTTYPLLQLAAGLPLLRAAVKEALNGDLRTSVGPPGESRQWYHPTAWAYLRLLHSQGVK